MSEVHPVKPVGPPSGYSDADNAPDEPNPIDNIAVQSLSAANIEPAHPEFKATLLKEGGKQWNLSHKILKFVAKFFSAAKEKLQAMESNKVTEVKKYHKTQMDISSEQKAAHVEYSNHGNFSAEGVIQVPAAFVKDGKVIIEAKNSGHKTAAMLAAGKGELPKVGPMKAPGLERPIISYSFVRTPESPIGVGASYPSWNFEGVEGGAEHLVNAYGIIIEGKEYGVIRTGMISKKEYADDFVALMREIISKLPPDKQGKPIRIVSQQLNSPDNERSIVDGQHRWMIHANNELSRDPGAHVQLVHINIPSNRWYFHTKNVERLGILGRALTSTVFKGERLSHEQNLEGWGTYVDWTRQALKDALELVERTESKLSDNVVQYLRLYSGEQLNKLFKDNPRKNEVRKEIDELVILNHVYKDTLKNQDMDKATRNQLKKELKEVNSQLKGKREEMRQILLNDYQNLTEVANEFATLLSAVLPDQKNTPEVEAMKNALEAVKLMKQVLGVQLGVPGQQVSRGQEGLLIQLLNDRLGVHSAMNCKSGLDRTGFWHAVKLSMVRIEKEDPTFDSLEFVENWDSNTTLINKLEARLNKDNETLADWMFGSPEKSHKDWLAKFGDLLPKGCIKQGKNGPEIDIGHFVHFKTNMRNVMKFRNMVAQNLLAVGIPITQLSTGVVGFKWNKGFLENLLPLNFIPSTVDAEMGKNVRLVNYNSDGSVKGITLWGRALLTKFHCIRGS